MDYTFNEIKKSEIRNQKFDGLFSNIDKDRKFGIISIDCKKYLIGWQSDLLLPKIYHNKSDSTIFMGVDLRLIAVEYKTDKVKIDMLLNYFFFNFYSYKNYLIVATELEIKVINLNSFQINTDGLPDIFESLVIENNKIIVVCMDKSEAIIEI